MGPFIGAPGVLTAVVVLVARAEWTRAGNVSVNGRNLEEFFGRKVLQTKADAAEAEAADEKIYE